MFYFITGLSIEFEEHGIEKTEYTDDLHPLYLYLKGNFDMRTNVILTHPDVIGFV